MGIYLGPVRVTRRGVRVRIGPRLLRLHFGAGGPGVSTGAGPFTWYRPLRLGDGAGSGQERPLSPQPGWRGVSLCPERSPPGHGADQALRSQGAQHPRHRGLGDAVLLSKRRCCGQSLVHLPFVSRDPPP